MVAARLVLRLCGAVILAIALPTIAQDIKDHDMAVSCYSGITVLHLRGPNDCQIRSKKLLPLTSPMDFSTDFPWDCLNSLLVSVEGCKITMVPTKNTSDALPDFACNWLEYQGYVESAYTGRLALWTRPIPAAKWVLYNTNLTSWRQQGAATLTVAELEATITEISRRNPKLPISEVMQQPEIVALSAAAKNFQQQLDMSPEEIAAALAGMAQQEQQQQAAAGASGGARKLLQEQQTAAAPAAGEPVAAVTPEVPEASPAAPPAAPPVASGKPPLPPGVEADVGNGLVSKPIAWQSILAAIYKSNGSPIYADLVNNTIVLFNNQRCNLTYEVESGGMLGVGTPDRSSVGKFALNSIEPYELPYILEVNRDILSAAAGEGSAIGPIKHANIALVTILSVLGAILVGALIYLAVRLARAPKAAASSRGSFPFDDGVGRTGAIAMSPLEVTSHTAMSSLEQQARQHGASGGI